MSTETQAPDAKGKVVWSVPLPPEVAAHVRVCSQGGYKSPEEYAGEAIRRFMGTPEIGEEDSIMSSDLMDVVNEIDYASCYIQAKLRVVLQVLEGAGNNLRELDYEELHGLAEIVREARQQIQERLIEPLYGAQPESAEAPTPPGTLTLDEDGVKDLIADLYRLSVAAAAGDDLSWSETQLRNAMKAIAAKVDRIVADIEGSAGMEISDAERDAIFGGVSSWGDKALRFGADAVEEELEGETPPSGNLTVSEEEVSALNVLIAAVGLASDGTLGTMTKLVCQEITPRPIRRILRKVLTEAAPALEKIEEASPYSGEDLLATRGEALKELVLEATEGMESY